MMATVGDIMVCDVRTISADEPLSAAAKRMAENGIRHLVVVGPDGTARGVLSERDVLRFLVRSLNQRLQRPKDALSKELTTNGMLSVRPDTPIAEAASLMAAQKIGCLPVLAADGKLVGIVGAIDILKYQANGASGKIDRRC